MTEWMYHICLTKSKIKKSDCLHLCIPCYDKVLELEKTKPYKITKNQIARGLKDEL
ncbi:hypothetical protein [Candidatus Nitrosarchaeum limnium]|jgi:hypothetical protein|uniref:Uncharacterized protein n=1 Tax=Candidatus Nitrosarchaeum limnium BG20 TaxID=859192 RepID=S2E5B3_9ARCH|nr:hypothetical protein [Candidatus Nitrosarchaeum limnium]EPA04671.1 hypothetical protein BG20_I1677 [Candidatus Nitrosarchaeum limnium BG20]